MSQNSVIYDTCISRMRYKCHRTVNHTYIKLYKFSFFGVYHMYIYLDNRQEKSKWFVLLLLLQNNKGVNNLK